MSDMQPDTTPQTRTAASTIESLRALAASPNDLKPQERQELLLACKAFIATASSAVDVAFDLAFANHRPSAVRIATDMGLLDAAASRLASDGVTDGHTGGALVRAPELAAAISTSNGANVETSLVTRLLRILSHAGFFVDEGSALYRPLPLVQHFRRDTPFSCALKLFQDVHAPVLRSLPAYLSASGWQDPCRSFDGPFQAALSTSKHHFDWLKDQPTYFHAFNVVMTAQRQGHGRDWFHVYPVLERLGQISDRITLVDVGGGVGVALQRLKAAFPQLAGSLVLQDLPSVISSVAIADPDIHYQGHDFFTPQPVRGASAYYLRTVLHDWADDETVVILQRIADAMNEHSVVLIDEFVLPEENPPLLACELDLSMMAMFASRERTRKQWTALVSSAGLEIIEIWDLTGGKEDTDSRQASNLIEARLKF